MQKSRDQNHHLSKLRDLVRRGLAPLSISASKMGEWQEEARKLIELCRGEALSTTEAIQLISLRSEFHDLLGQEAEAEDLISHYVVPAGEDMMRRVRPNGKDPLNEAALKREDTARLVRQVVWLHLEYAWVCYYRKGEYNDALRYLNEVLRFMNKRLIPLRPKSHGTLSRYFFYRAHCERGLRRFRASNEALSESQNHAHLRYLSKIEELSAAKSTDPEEIKDTKVKKEHTFAIICTARILGGGIAWNAIHQGQLTYAKNVCLSAQTLLEDTGQEPYKLLIETNRLVAERRATERGTKQADDILHKLRHLYSEHESIGSHSGQIRCGLEFIRGRLEGFVGQAENDPERRKAENREIRWMLRSLAATIEKASGGRLKEWKSWKTWTARARLLRLRYSLYRLTTHPGKELGDRARDVLLREATRLEEAVRDTHLVVEHGIVRGLIQTKAGRHDKAVDSFKNALDNAHEDDPVLRGECHLELAEAYRLVGNFVSARNALDDWWRVARAVDNAFLHQFASMIRQALEAAEKPFVIRVEDNLEWAVCERRLRLWLAGAARLKAIKELGEATGKAISTILGIDASSWSRWPKQ